MPRAAGLTPIILSGWTGRTHAMHCNANKTDSNNVVRASVVAAAAAAVEAVRSVPSHLAPIYYNNCLLLVSTTGANVRAVCAHACTILRNGHFHTTTTTTTIWYTLCTRTLSALVFVMSASRGVRVRVRDDCVKQKITHTHTRAFAPRLQQTILCGDTKFHCAFCLRTYKRERGGYFPRARSRAP